MGFGDFNSLVDLIKREYLAHKLSVWIFVLIVLEELKSNTQMLRVIVVDTLDGKILSGDIIGIDIERCRVNHTGNHIPSASPQYCDSLVCSLCPSAELKGYINSVRSKLLDLLGQVITLIILQVDSLGCTESLCILKAGINNIGDDDFLCPCSCRKSTAVKSQKSGTLYQNYISLVHADGLHCIYYSSQSAVSRSCNFVRKLVRKLEHSCSRQNIYIFAIAANQTRLDSRVVAAGVSILLKLYTLLRQADLAVEALAAGSHDCPGDTVTNFKCVAIAIFQVRGTQLLYSTDNLVSEDKRCSLFSSSHNSVQV